MSSMSWVFSFDNTSELELEGKFSRYKQKRDAAEQIMVIGALNIILKELTFHIFIIISGD